MGIYNSIIFLVVNVLCLATTLLLPNPSTPASLIPVIVYSCIWIFKTSNYGNEVLSKAIRVGVIILAASIAACCALCVLTATIETENTTEYTFALNDECNAGTISMSSSTVGGDYLIRVRPDVAIIGNKTIAYKGCAITSFIVVTLLLVSDTIAAIILPRNIS